MYLLRCTTPSPYYGLARLARPSAPPVLRPVHENLRSEACTQVRWHSRLRRLVAPGAGERNADVLAIRFTPCPGSPSAASRGLCSRVRGRWQSMVNGASRGGRVGRPVGWNADLA